MLHTEPLVRRSNRPRPIRTRERKIHALETHPVNKKGVDDEHYQVELLEPLDQSIHVLHDCAWLNIQGILQHELIEPLPIPFVIHINEHTMIILLPCIGLLHTPLHTGLDLVSGNYHVNHILEQQE